LLALEPGFSPAAGNRRHAMTTKPEAVNAMTTPLSTVTPEAAALNAADLSPTAAWSRRVRRIGGFIQAAAFVLPVVVIAAGRSDWVLPSIVITIGPLLLYLDHLVHIPRYRPVGWALIAGPVLLIVTMSGSPLAVTTGIAAGVVLLGTAAAGFHDLAGLRPARRAGPARLSTKAQ
jgi:hypothetical protein